MPPFWIPLIWLLIAGGLLSLELAQPSFDGLMVAALAALLLSLLTALTPLPLLVQILLFLVLTVVGTVWLSRWSARRNPRPGQERQREDLAEVISAIPPGGEGRVRWHGQSWAASSLDLDQAISDGEQVLVVGRDGTQLQVIARFRP
jgi:membrane protein implicated in regulation of membrane protease activity